MGDAPERPRTILSDKIVHDEAWRQWLLKAGVPIDHARIRMITITITAHNVLSIRYEVHGDERMVDAGPPPATFNAEKETLNASQARQVSGTCEGQGLA